MRMMKLTALILALLFLLCACGVRSEGTSYADDGHTHVYGYWYDATLPSCRQRGARVRYCKICHAEQGMTIEIPDDVTKQVHTYTETTVEPTEKDAGSFIRKCDLCSYVEEEYEIPALYALKPDENTVTTAPAGVNAMLLSDTETHTVSALANEDALIDATLARRLAVALPVVEQIGQSWNAQHTVTVSAEMLGGVTPTTPGVYVGATLSVKQILGLWLMEGGDDTVLLLCSLMGQSEAQLLATVNARMDKLGVALTASSLRQSGTPAGVTVYDTAVLVARVLDEPLICELLALNTNPYITVNGQRPALYFKAGDVRVSAISREEGYAFLVLQGAALPGGIENSLYAS